MANSTVRVRMYRQGFGDCFLLSFSQAENGAGNADSNFHMLIDCGVLLGTRDPEETMRSVVSNIKEVTGGHLNLVVATHEHWDHLSGYTQARELWDSMRIDQVWVAWTEDATNELANRLRESRKHTVLKLSSSLAQINTHLGAQGRAIEEVLGFFGPAPTDAAQPSGAAENGALAAAGAGGSGGGSATRAALDYIMHRPDATVRFCHPGEGPLSLNGVEGVRVYVLGPPEDQKLITTSDPGSVSEIYGFTRPSAQDSFFAAVGGSEATPGESELASLCFPFDEDYRVSPADAMTQEFFNQYYGFDPPGQYDPAPKGADSRIPSTPATPEPAPEESNGGSADAVPAGDRTTALRATVASSRENTGAAHAPKGTGPAWRRIDTDWMAAASQLALALDSDTNNTSLALAIELAGSGNVLLFPADAQYGNIVSWGPLSWSIQNKNGQIQQVSSQDLLARTILYKAGHHGSHNATLRGKELELMTNPGLIAMCPVNRDMAAQKHWNIPYPQLLTRLKQKTRGRLLLADVDALPPRSDAPDLTDLEWQLFTEIASVEPLWVDCTFDL